MPPHIFLSSFSVSNESISISYIYSKQTLQDYHVGITVSSFSLQRYMNETAASVCFASHAYLMGFHSTEYVVINK